MIGVNYWLHNFYYWLERLKRFWSDPFLKKRIETLQIRILMLEEQLAVAHGVTAPSPEYTEPEPEPPKPFRVRYSMRDRRAKKEAAMNKFYRNIQALKEFEEKHVHNQVRQDLRQPAVRQSDGPSGHEAGPQVQERLSKA